MNWKLLKDYTIGCLFVTILHIVFSFELAVTTTLGLILGLLINKLGSNKSNN